ncbi:hypothetical protein Peur_009774 [Populus x canadensis]
MARQALPLFEKFSHCLCSATKASLSQAHAHILKTGISLPETIQIFSKLNHFGHVIRVFSYMLTQGIVPDSRVLPTVIKTCAALSALQTGKQMHCFALVSGLGLDSVVLSSLLHMYVQFDRLKDARNVFDKLPQPGVVSSSALISRFARKGRVKETKELFYQTRDLGVELNLVSWNGMISGFNRSGSYLDAVLMFQNMHLEGLKPDGTSVSSVLPAVGDLEMPLMGIQIHCYVIKQGLGPDKFVVSALIDMYGKCACASEMSGVFNEMDEVDVGACNALVTGLSRNGLVDNALEVFKQFKGMDLNVVSWTSMIASCSQNGKDIEALELFREMQIEGVKPNSVTIPCVLPACGNIAALLRGKAAHCFSLRNGIFNDVYVGSALIDMYAKCGRMLASRLCFDMMPNRNLVSWNSLMAGYAMHGKTFEAINIFELMQRCGQKPDHVSFTCVLSACTQGGLTEEGWFYFDSMSRNHGVEARMEHYSCMVTLLGRSGRLEEAYAMIKQMPFEPDSCVWGALLSSCRVHNRVDLGEIAAKRVFELEPRNPGNYILLSNIYASKAMWVEVDMVRDMMRSRGLKKNPGYSWIEIKNKVHMLLAGDSSHPQMPQIIEKLAKLTVEMKKSGYVPHTDFVLQDVEEQDKEQILCGHSEKLAVVLGLLNTKPGFPLQVIKNLRICRDCHAVIKFISDFEKREIFVRDTNRFHQFKGGVCSCGDYW